jgi:hypothetical protein
MELHEYQASLEKVPFGKRLPGALYIFRTADAKLGDELDALLVKWVQRYEISEEVNIIKFRTDELKVSFLA